MARTTRKTQSVAWPKFAAESAEERFRRLAQQWIEGSPFESSLAYQKIIGMGWAAVPFILEELKSESQAWFWALQVITDVNPVPAEDAGNVEKMAEAWLNWGRENSIIE